MSGIKSDIARLNWTQYVPGQRKGHYESFYQRANHPTEPLAFWIRYTIFSPKDRPEAAIGELWAIFFDGTTGEHVVVKEEHPLAECTFDTRSFGATVKDSTLVPGALRGRCESLGSSIGWDLSYSGDSQPMFLLPQNMYHGGFPKAKSLVGTPLARYDGQLTVDDRTIDVNGWVGSQNHNWGSQHTDYYAFGQVAGFDESPDTFLEVVTAQAKVGPLTTPFVTFAALRHNGVEHSAVSLRRAITAKGRFHYFSWQFATESDHATIVGRFTAEPRDFVGLNYYNPPGGIKHCLNTKIGTAELVITDKATGHQETLRTGNRALFEILTDDRAHGIAIRA